MPEKGYKMLKVRKIMTATLSPDHLVVGGVIGAKFMQYVKKLLKNPIALLCRSGRHTFISGGRFSI